MNERICLREGCGCPVPGGRRKYCSRACLRAMTLASADARRRERAAAAAARRAKTRAMRTCLSCGRAFSSEGSWNRACRRCSNMTDGGRERVARVGTSDRAEEMELLEELSRE